MTLVRRLIKPTQSTMLDSMRRASSDSFPEQVGRTSPGMDCGFDMAAADLLWPIDRCCKFWRTPPLFKMEGLHPEGPPWPQGFPIDRPCSRQHPHAVDFVARSATVSPISARGRSRERPVPYGLNATGLL